MAPGLEVTGLSVALGAQRVLEGVALTVAAGRLHALVGESGSGKTMTARAVLGLLPAGLEPVSGVVRVGGREVAVTRPLELAALRGRLVALVPSEAQVALDPVLTVGSQLAEALWVHHRLRGAEGRARALQLLVEVDLPDPERCLSAYPHQLSGGMCQRALLAAALAGDPAMLIADEPTSALDPSVQGVVLGLLRRLAATRQLGVLLITHDLQVVADACDDVSVLYAGRIVEQGPALELLSSPRHPYTQALVRVRPVAWGTTPPAGALQGQAPSPAEEIAGCRFHPRCPLVTASCRERAPQLVRGASGRAVACHEAPPS